MPLSKTQRRALQNDALRLLRDVVPTSTMRDLDEIIRQLAKDKEAVQEARAQLATFDPGNDDDLHAGPLANDPQPQER